MTIGGLFLGAAGAGIFVVLLNYVIQPQMSVETRGVYAVRDDRFNVWYHDGSPARAGYSELKARLEESLDDLLVRLDVDSSEIPLPIDVLVHDDPGQLQSSIIQRKSSLATYTFGAAVIDLFAGEDPYPRLAELVLAFGWGQCYSQLLYTGTTMLLADPDRSFHPTVAAAPSRLRYSLEALLELDANGHFSETLYQQFDSPYSERMAFGSFESIAVFYSLFGDEGNLVPEEDFASLQSASLVEYLIQCSDGMAALKAVWGPGASRALFEQLASGPLADLGEAWHRTAIAEGQTGALYDYYRALSLFEAGEFEEAHRLTQAWGRGALTDEDVVLAARCAISVGEFEEASEWIEGAGLSSGRPADWVALFSGWRRVVGEDVSVFGDRSEEELTRLLAEVQEARERVATGLAFTEDELPQRITVFLYEDAETRQAGESVTPAASMHQTAWHVVLGEDVAWALASTLPAYAYRVSTASNLLRTGVATAVTVEAEDLAEQGCRILTDGEWTPLWQLGFGGVTSGQFRTQTGLMIRYLIDGQGLEIVRQLWRATSREGGMSFDSAILELAGTSRRDIEQVLLNSVLVCD